MFEIETLTEILTKVAPQIEAVIDEANTEVGFYRFKEGLYEGVVYTYANIQFKEIDDQLEISFQYLMMQDPLNNQPNNAVDEEAFKQHIGEILVNIIDASWGVENENDS